MTETTAATDPTVTPAAVTPEGRLKQLCDDLRAQLLGIEQFVRSIKDHAAIKQPDTFPGQHGEMIAQSMLAVRHIEDARMRLGKVLQYGRDGVSIFDRPEPQP